MTVTTLPLTKAETAELADKYRSSLKMQNAMGFADTTINPPDIDFYLDYEQFFDSAYYIIHIGAYGITERFEAKCEEDFLEALNFVRGHEEEHCRSTAQRPYAIGIQKGCEEIIKYISSVVDKGTRRFRTPKDYEHYANVTLPSMGIYINWGHMQSIVGGIANSLEDGRIERIRSARFPGFERLRIKYRGIFWNQSKEDDTGIDPEKNPAEKLRLILNNILTLATCQLYEKGFAMKYHGTPIMNEINALMPNIARAYMANRCKDMSMEVIEISKRLAPLIYEVCKMSAEDVAMKKAFEDVIRKLIEASIENNIFNPGGNLQESDEMTGDDDMPRSTFPVSDLVVTLPDDVYDKLEKNSSNKDGNIIVKREHPKEEEKTEDKSTSKGANSSDNKSEKGSDEKTDGSENTSENGSSENFGTSGESSDGSTGESSGGSTGEDSGSSSEGSSDDSSEGVSDSSSEGNSDGSSATKDNGKDDSSEKACESESKKGSSESSGEQTKGTGRGSSDNDSENIDQVLKAMKEAAEQTKEEAKRTISNVNTHNSHEKRTRDKSEVKDKEPVVPESIGKEIGHRFKEVKRMYKVIDRLPPVLQARGRAMFRKNQRYFKSLSKPTVKNLDSGSVDPGRIYGLSFGDTEIFQKIGKDKQFDGCAYMLIDNSGSMCGNKRIESAKAGAVIEEGFRKMFPLKIVAFDENGPIIHEVIKNWDEWLGQNCCWNYALHGRSGAGNEDGYDIKVATKELLARPEKKKMLVVLSDGAPGSRSLVNKAVKDARRKGIEVYSIYFEEGSVGRHQEEVMREMYEKDYVVCPLDELDENLYKLFKKFSRS